MAKKEQKGRHDPIKIYADAVKLQNVMMRLLVSSTARAYRYTVVEELFRMSVRLIETVDMMNMLHGQERLRSLLEIGALVRTVQTTVGNRSPADTRDRQRVVQGDRGCRTRWKVQGKDKRYPSVTPAHSRYIPYACRLRLVCIALNLKTRYKNDDENGRSMRPAA